MGRIAKKFTVKDGYDFKTIVIRELTGLDELEAAVWADKHKSSAIGKRIQDEQQESIRLAIVSVDGVKVVQPYMQIDEWGYRSLRLLREFYAEVNGIEPGEVKNALATAEIISGNPTIADSPPPSSEG